MTATRILLGASALALGLHGWPLFAEVVPLVGLDGPEADACGGIGRVAGIFAPAKDAYLPVRGERDEYAREKDRLVPGTLVWLCDGRDGWQGIVYPTGDFQELGDCRVSSSKAAPEPYSGPCRSGWVPARSLQLVGE